MSDSRYIRFDTDPCPAPGFATKALSVLLGDANPDFYESYQRVTYWWLEIDHKGEVLREIGFDAFGQVLAIAPFGKNYGVFTDSGLRIDTAEPDVDMSAFIDTWQAAEQTFAA